MVLLQLLLQRKQLLQLMLLLLLWLSQFEFQIISVSRGFHGAPHIYGAPHGVRGLRGPCICS